MVVVFIYFYLFPYQRVVHHPMILFKLDKVFLINRFFYGLTLLSSVFHSKFILVLGVIPLVLIFYIFKNFLLFSRLHIAMLLFLLISFGSLTISRDGFGYEQAFSSRYQFNTVVLYSVIFSISAFFKVSILYKNSALNSDETILFSSLCFGIFTQLLLNITTGLIKILCCANTNKRY